MVAGSTLRVSGYNEGSEGEGKSMVEYPSLPNFTAPAQHLWARIPQLMQRKVLDTVWCPTCRKATTMIHYSGRVIEGDLLLTGRCAACGNKVARLLESE
jgi:endogenous inhibitor of DNA gyrase (YacG/DUF329 family)